MARRKKAAKKGARKAKPSASFEHVHKTKIRVIGVGGGGGNIVAEIAAPLQKFEFVGANTDTQALRQLPKKVRSFSFGGDFTFGLGCGMDAELGERVAKAEKERIKRLLEGSDICVLIASLGGGTGSGAVPTFAEVAQGLRCLTIGIFTMPFAFEGERRKQIAETSLEKIKHSVNAYVVVPNEAIFQIIDEKTPLKAALSAVNKRLTTTLEGFMDTLSLPGIINIDFADVRAILEGRGRLAYLNSAEAAGPARAQEALQKVLANSLYGYSMAGADRVLFNITSDRNLKMQEVALISSGISQHNTKARIVFGVSVSSRLKDRLRVTLFAVGCDTKEKKEPPQQQKGPKKRLRQRKTKLAHKKRTKKEKALGEAPEPQSANAEVAPEGSAPRRRNALEVKNAIDEEMRELEKKEKQWDIPAFLRNK